jgi:hypothetical protein
LLYTEATQQSGFFLKKKPPSAELVSAYVLENRSKALLIFAALAARLKSCPFKA